LEANIYRAVHRRSWVSRHWQGRSSRCRISVSSRCRRMDRSRN